MPIWLLLAALFGSSAIALDANGYHGLGGIAESERVAYATATRYQLLHALALVGVALLAGRHRQPRPVAAAGFAFAIGIVLFSGGIYLNVLLSIDSPSFVAPIGGPCLIAGWALLALYAIDLMRKSGRE